LRKSSYFKGLFKAEMAFEIFADGFFQVHIVDVGKGGEPGEDVGEFFLFIFLVGAGQGGGEFADFLDKPQESSGRAAFAVAPFVFFTDNLLEFFYGYHDKWGRFNF